MPCLLVLAVLAFGGSFPSAQAPGPTWLADDVAAVVLGQPNCIRYPRVNGFGFGQDGTPMVGWTQVEGCGGSNLTYWSEKLADGWLRRQWGDQGFWSGPNGFAHEFEVGADGRPYLFMVGGNGTSLTYGTYRADLRAHADGESYLVATGEHLANHQQCVYVTYRPAAGPGQAWPYRATFRGQCLNDGPLRFEGATLVDSVIIRGFDLAMGVDGRAHIAYTDGPRVFYIRPGFGPALVADNLNRFNDDVAIQVGVDGTLHLVVRGFNAAGGDNDRGLVGYLQSVDDGATWQFVDWVDQSRLTYGLSLRLDSTGAPALAYWRYGYGLMYTTRASGAWVESRVVAPGFSGTEWVKPPHLRFNAAGVPHIAYYDWTANRIRISSPWIGAPGEAPPVDLGVTGNVSPTPTVSGTPVTLTLQVENHAAGEASGVRVRVTLPAGSTASSLDPSPMSNAGGVLTFDQWRVPGGGVGRDRLAAGATGTITFNVSGLPSGVAEFPVVVSSTEADLVSTDNSTVLTARVNEASCSLPVSGRTAWWPGDGTALNYGGGAPYHGTVVGNVTYGAGAVGQAFVFDGVTGHVQVPNGYDEYYWPLSGALSVGAWARTSRNDSSVQVIASMDDMANAPCCGSPQGSSAFYLYVQDGVFKGSMRNNQYGAPAVNVVGQTTVADGKFHHAALVIDTPALQARLYVDGQLEASTPLTPGWTMNNGDFEAEFLVIGGAQVIWGTGYRYFLDGAVDDVSLYKRVLTPAEIGNAASGPSREACGAPVLNSPPVAVDDAAGPGDIDVLANDTDRDGDPLTIVGVATPPAKGTATIAGSSITYAPTWTIYDGADSFTYTISDGRGGTASATVTIATPAESLADVSVRLLGVERGLDDGLPWAMFRVRNDGPATEPRVGFTSFAEQGAGVVQLGGLRQPTPGAWCELPYGDDQATCTITNMAPGAEVDFRVLATPLTSDSPRTFQLAASAYGERVDPDYANNSLAAPVTIPFSTSDLAVSLSASRASYRIGDPVTFVVDVRNDGPDVSVVSQLALVLDGAGTSASECTAGSVNEGRQEWTCLVPSLAPGGRWTAIFDHLSSVTGARTSTAHLDVASQWIWMTDPAPGNNLASLETAAHVNRAPAAVDDLVETDEDTALVIAPTTLTGNDTDEDGDSLVLTGVSTPANGAVTFDGTEIVFTPAPDFHGAASFQYQVSDGQGGTASGTAQVTVRPVNDDPVVPDQLVHAVGGVPLVIPIGATDVDGDRLAYSIRTGPEHGTADLVDDTLVYTAAAKFDGSDSVEVLADDGAGGVSVGRIRIAVDPSNDPPAFADVAASVPANGTLTLTLSAADPDGDVLTYLIVDGPKSGAANLVGPQLTYEPAPDFVGTDTLLVEARDGRGGASGATVTIVVTPVNRAPWLATPIADVTLLEDALPLAIGLDGVFKDPDGGDGLAYSASSDNPAVAMVSVDSAAGIVTITPMPDAFGAATVTLTASDGEFTVHDQFLVTVAAVNDAPTLNQPANVRVVGGTAVVVPLTGLSAGPANEFGQILNATAVSSSAEVTGLVSASLADLRFTPPARTSVGVATVTVEMADNGGTANGGLDRTTRTFAVTILPPPPTVTAPLAQTSVVGATVSLPVTYTAYPDAPLYFTATGLPPGLSIDPDTGVIAGMLGDQPGAHAVTVILFDGIATSTAAFTWQVTAAVVTIVVEEQISVIDTVEVRPAVVISIAEVVTVTDDVNVRPPVVISIDEAITVSDAVEAQATNTPVGVGQRVPMDGGVTLVFSQVTVAGQTTAVSTAAAPSLPAGYVMATPPRIVDIGTTAGFTGSVEVCVSYDPGAFSTADQRLFHHDGTTWRDITTGNRRQTSTVCGTTTHFSPFAVVEAEAVESQDGRITGEGRLDAADGDHAFHLRVSEGARRRPNDRLRYEKTTIETVTTPGKSGGKGKATPSVTRRVERTDRFEATEITQLTFFDDAGFSPGRPRSRVVVDSVTMSGVGRWNGVAGYTFEARAEDRGEPGRGRDTFAITIRSPQGAVVATVDDVITSGNIQSHKVGRR